MAGVGATSTQRTKKAHAAEENRAQPNEEKNALHFERSASDGECWSEWWCRWWMEKEIQWMNAEEHTRKCVLCQQCLHSIDTKTESKQEKGTRKKNSINFLLLLLSSFTFYRPLSRFAHLLLRVCTLKNVPLRMRIVVAAAATQTTRRYFPLL